MGTLARKLMVAGSSLTPLTIALTDDRNSTGAFTSGTVGTEAIGDAPTGGARRFVFFVMAGINTTSSRTLTSCTIGGVSATIEFSVSSTACLGVAWAEVPTGTTASIAATWSGNLDGFAYNVYTVYSGPDGITVNALAASTATTTTLDFNLTTANGGVALACACSRSGSSNSWSFTNATENYEVDFNSNDRLATATAETTGPSLTIGIVRSGTYSANNRGALAILPA